MCWSGLEASIEVSIVVLGGRRDLRMRRMCWYEARVSRVSTRAMMSVWYVCKRKTMYGIFASLKPLQLAEKIRIEVDGRGGRTDSKRS